MAGTMALDASVLSGISVFARLDREHSHKVFACMKPLSILSGTPLFREGDPGDELYVVVSGKVAISITPRGGEEFLLSEIDAGGFFGEMSIIDHSPRSADCKAVEDSLLLSLSASDFDSLLMEHPKAAVRILDTMLEITSARLLKTGAFLSEMVRWGDAARKRAVTDPATGLFNRRYMEETFDDLLTHAKVEGKKVSIVMFDMDHFGSINKEYGMAVGDSVILEASRAFRAVFSPKDILVRYGGDEFVFLFVDTGPEEAAKKCDALCAAFREIRLTAQPGLRLSCSMGFASCPDHAVTLEGLKVAADRALYRAKEAGRDRAAGANPDDGRGETMETEKLVGKHEIYSIAEKNRIVRNIIDTLENSDDFLLVGHQSPDEDCLGAMVAFGLIAGRFGKHSTIATNSPISENYRYLINICRYNSIRVTETGIAPGDKYKTVVIMDTPKPSMLDHSEPLAALMSDPSVRKIEVDHHLETDAQYSGDPGYRLVTNGSSSCELLAVLAFKIQRDAELLKRYEIQDLFSRNLVLALLTGIVGDSGMGKFLKTRRERWFYSMFSNAFEDMLTQKTYSGMGNYASKEELFTAVTKLSSEEDECYRFIMRREEVSDHIRYIAIPKEESDDLYRVFGHDIVAAVARSVADELAERSGFVSLVAYHDDPAVSTLVQFRMRRSQGYSGLDLRKVLETMRIENGGGHPGAVGFRFEGGEIRDIGAKAAEIIARVEALVGEGDVS